MVGKKKKNQEDGDESDKVVANYSSSIERSESTDGSYHATPRMPPPSAAVQEVLRGGRGNLKLPFAYKLHMLLEEMEREQTLDVISWVNDGSAFQVHNPDAFARTLMTRYFRQSKFTSFVRQVRKATSY